VDLNRTLPAFPDERRDTIISTITLLLTASMQSRGNSQTLPITSILAPTGKLRAAVIASNPVLITLRRDGTLGGVSIALAEALAAYLSVPVEFRPYDNPKEYNESLASDIWDIGLAARDPSRAEYLAFSETFMEVANGYVARPGATLERAEDVDQAGIKIAVAIGSAPHSVLQRLIKNAEIVPLAGGFEPALEALAMGKADVYGDNLHLAYRVADTLPGARVLPGHFNVVQMAIGVRKRAVAVLPVIDAFVNQIRAGGTVQKAINEVGLRGVQLPQQRS
jgi:polar amino acid transport system substrate-binding protein